MCKHPNIKREEVSRSVVPETVGVNHVALATEREFFFNAIHVVGVRESCPDCGHDLLTAKMERGPAHFLDEVTPKRRAVVRLACQVVCAAMKVIINECVEADRARGAKFDAPADLDS